MDYFFDIVVPSSTKILPEDYVERVKKIHEFGGYQSRGYGSILPILNSMPLTLVKVLTFLDSVFNRASCLDMGMIGKERKRTRIFCGHTLLLFRQECCMH